MGLAKVTNGLHVAKSHPQALSSFHLLYCHWTEWNLPSIMKHFLLLDARTLGSLVLASTLVAVPCQFLNAGMAQGSVL